MDKDFSVYKSIEKLLNEEGVEFQTLQHHPTFTSQQSAAVRGESLSSGAKAILYKVQNEFHLFVLAADRRLDPKKIKEFFKNRGERAKKSRFATEQELKSMTGLAPGSVPPFGRPILNFDLYVDHSLLVNESISFNAGSLEHSISMKVMDYLSVNQPLVFSFTRRKN